MDIGALLGPSGRIGWSHRGCASKLRVEGARPRPWPIRPVCRELGAEDKGALIQRDTYFEVPRGRLKLREESDAIAHLIAYERPDLAGYKESRYRLIEVREPLR